MLLRVRLVTGRKQKQNVFFSETFGVQVYILYGLADQEFLLLGVEVCNGPTGGFLFRYA